jgi:hypothetical protein
MFDRRDSRQKIILQDHLSAWANGVRKRGARLSPGPEQDDMLKKANQADTASRLVDWANSPGLKSPKRFGADALRKPRRDLAIESIKRDLFTSLLLHFATLATEIERGIAPHPANEK